MKPAAVCFGEVLWDIFPNHKKIGGAPLNVALRLQSLGIETTVISRVGQDADGKKLLEYINNNPVNTDCIQIDPINNTGKVNVVVDNDGIASYTIEYPTAWDKIKVEPILIDRVMHSEAFIFGSLSTRDPVSKSTLFELLQYAKFKVFDVNLRAPHYSQEVILEQMKYADIIKLNNEEILHVCEFNKLYYNDIKDQIKAISILTHTDTICVTLGEKGAVLYSNQKFYHNQGYKVQVADTVGSGDSFLASLITSLLNKITSQEALDVACAYGALVASKEGANPKIAKKEILSIMQTNN